jgi:16S rRNA (uracil1498-N3)-methyltransferase
MSERFFVEVPIQGPHARLVEGEAQHVAKVMRAKVGDQITLFDGSGAEFLATITALSRQAVECEILERREIDRELARDVTIAVALPKGDRQQWLVEKLTELGATRLVPLVCQRSVAQPVDSALARLRRWSIEAAKQCGRNRLLEIASPEKWPQYTANATAAIRLFAHPGQDTRHALGGPQDSLIAAIGPEGGWSDEEVANATSNGWQAVSLGPRILRVETAAIALAVLAGAPSGEATAQ